MALQLALTEDQTEIGVSFPEAYAKISYIEINTKSGQVRIACDINATKAARDAGKSPVTCLWFIGNSSLDLDASQPDGMRAALYEWLKVTQPIFANAIDV
jgi:hypothetical protein